MTGSSAQQTSYYTTSGSNSVVECNLAKVEVEGSNPFSRSIFLLHSTRYNSKGAVAKWLRPGSAKPLSAVRIRPAPPISFLADGFQRFSMASVG